jgi:hypothetical protein
MRGLARLGPEKMQMSGLCRSSAFFVQQSGNEMTTYSSKQTMQLPVAAILAQCEFLNTTVKFSAFFTQLLRRASADKAASNVTSFP